MTRVTAERPKLRYHSESGHPNKQYWEGYRAFIDGKLPDWCPYPPRSVEAEDWHIGWKDAGYDV